MDADLTDQTQATTALAELKPQEARALSLIDAPAGLLPAPLAALREVAELLSAAGPMIPAPFRGKPDVCLAIAYQAARWRMDPVAVASKAYITNDQVRYEAQLIAALVYRSPKLIGMPKIGFHGEGAKRYCHVVATLRADPRDPKEYVSPVIGQIKVKNSPLWFSDPDQQLAYYSVRAWARRWMPEEILGVYTPEEMAPAYATDEAGARIDPFDDETETPPADPPTPSGGEGWQEHADAEVKARDERREARQKRRNGKRQDRPAPSGGGSAPPPKPEVEAAWKFCMDRARGIMNFDIAPPARTAWDILTKTKEWGVLKAYEQGKATTIKNMVAEHIRKVAADTPGAPAQPDPQADGPDQG